MPPQTSTRATLGDALFGRAIALIDAYDALVASAGFDDIAAADMNWARGDHLTPGSSNRQGEYASPTFRSPERPLCVSMARELTAASMAMS